MTETETKEPKPEAGNQGVQLGIGTLIVIALIVTMCSGRGEMEKIQKDTAHLKKQLSVIEGKLDALAPQNGPGPADAANAQDATATPPDAVEADSRNP